MKEITIYNLIEELKFLYDYENKNYITKDELILEFNEIYEEEKNKNI